MKRHVVLFCILGCILLSSCKQDKALYPDVPVTIHKLPDTSSPTPTVSMFHAAAWVTNNAPGVGSMVEVTGKFTTDDAQPVEGAKAQVDVNYIDGIGQVFQNQANLISNRDGIIHTDVPVLGEGRQGAYVTVIFTYNGQNFSGQTFFTSP